MNCPRCENGLKEIKYEGVVLDTCEQCGGEWVSHKELLHIVNTEETEFPDDDRAKIAGVNKVMPVEIDQGEKSLVCPKCHDPLHALNYGYSTGIVIDRCDTCRGVWLDREELEHIQIVIEERKKQLPEIEEKFAPVLAKIKEDTDKDVRGDIQSTVEDLPSPFGIKLHFFHPLVKAILWRLLE